MFTLTACTPTIQLDTPKEGITINMNVVVDHNIKVEMDEKSQKAVSEVDSSKKSIKKAILIFRWPFFFLSAVKF